MTLFQNWISSLPPAAGVIISVAVMMFFGFALTRVTKLLRLPNVTAYIVAGILIGPFALNIVSAETIRGMDFLPDIALAFIAFGTGEFFKLSVLKKNGAKVVVITVLESVAASAAVFSATYLLLGVDFSFSVVLAALAAATAPASTMMTIRQTGAKGDFVNTLLQVVAFDDIVGLVMFSIATSLAVTVLHGGGANAAAVVKPILVNLGVMLLGGAFGFFLKFLMTKKRSNDNRLIISIATLFAFCGVCTLLDVSPLLGCMSMGSVYANVTDDDKLFKQLNYFSPPILLLFFVRSGVTFDLHALVSTEASIAGKSLLLIGVVYFFVRILGKYAGAFLGCLAARKPREVRNYLGLALVPQAGVAIGLAAIGARTLGGEAGNTLQTVILASSVLYELIGPACAKLALWLSHSYRTDLEEVELPEEAEKLSAVEQLVARINAVKKELPERTPEEDNENAFTEAAEEYFKFSHNNNSAFRRYWKGRR